MIWRCFKDNWIKSQALFSWTFNKYEILFYNALLIFNSLFQRVESSDAMIWTQNFLQYYAN